MAAIPSAFDMSDFNWRPVEAGSCAAVDAPALFAAARSKIDRTLGQVSTVAKPLRKVAASGRGRKRKSDLKTGTLPVRAKRRACKTEGREVNEPATPMMDVETVKLGVSIVRVPRRQHRTNGRKMIVMQYEDLEIERRELYDELKAFYEGTNYVETIVYQFGEELHEVALRLVNCSVTSYAPYYRVQYRIDTSGRVFDIGPGTPSFDLNTNVVIDLVEEYEQQLTFWNKKMFDSCRRHERIPWKLADGTLWITTLGQLNFFRWAIKIRLLQWCRMHRGDLTRFLKAQDKEAARNQHQARSENKRPTRKRRLDTSVAQTTMITYTHPVPVRVWASSFEA
jgi:hypothetical protein